jgi:hypothetical protein
MKLKRIAMLRLARWHRRMGLLLACLLVLLATTGILINHSADFDLDQPVENSLILAWYGIKVPDQIIGMDTTQGWFSQLGTGIYWQEKRVAQCDEATFTGALLLPNQIILACRQLLFVVDYKGRIEERLDPLFGLPVPITGLAKNETGEPLVRVATDQNQSLVYGLNLDAAEWSSVASTELQNWPVLRAIPPDLERALLSGYDGAEISWERVLLDLHSGRLLGQMGNWFMDLVAIFILILAGSGIRLWWVRSPRK